eukprot:snap_masked-scaffold_45-processed-gene-1.62-mRNA-1 protein AED:1.00 eAED:1.00 QI:0/-1/0/0/-1/1/1/0/59
MLFLDEGLDTQVSRTALKKEGKLGFSRSNANGKLLENWPMCKNFLDFLEQTHHEPELEH